MNEDGGEGGGGPEGTVNGRRDRVHSMSRLVSGEARGCARTSGTNGRMGRNLIKKKETEKRKKKSQREVYYNFKGLANGAECPIVGRSTRNRRTRVRMVEYLARRPNKKKKKKKTLEGKGGGRRQTNSAKRGKG